MFSTILWWTIAIAIASVMLWIIVIKFFEIILVFAFLGAIGLVAWWFDRLMGML